VPVDAQLFARTNPIIQGQEGFSDALQKDVEDDGNSE
jgi:hypothetical protein